MPVFHRPSRLSQRRRRPPGSAPSTSTVWTGTTPGDTTAGISLQIAWDTPPGEAPTETAWTEHIASVYRNPLRITGGRTNEQDQFAPRTLTVTLDNTNRDFDPENVDGPYFGKLTPNRPIRLRYLWGGVVYDRFTGFVDGWPQRYHESGNEGAVDLTAYDRFGLLAAIGLPSVWEWEIRKDAPAIWWRCAERAGTAMVDSSGHGFDGRWVGGATFNSRSGLTYGDDDNAIELDGDDMYGVGPAVGPVPWDGPLVLEAIYTPLDAGVTTAAIPILAISNPDASAAPSFEILSRWDDSAGKATLHAGGRLQATGAAAGTTQGVEEDGDGVAAGAPHHVVAMWNPAGSGFDVSLFRDGAQLDVAPDFLGTSHGCLVGTFTANGETVLKAVVDELLAYAPIDIGGGAFNPGIDSARIAAHHQAMTAPWDGQRTGARIDAILDMVGVPVSLRSIDAGVSVLGPADLQGQKALGYLQKVAETDGGLLYVDGSGRITFVDRHALLTDPRHTTSQATFGHGADVLLVSPLLLTSPTLLTGGTAELPFTFPLNAGADRRLVRNEVETSTINGTRVRVQDDASRAVHGPAGYRRSLLTESVEEARDAANWLLAHYKDAIVRIPTLTVKPRIAPSDLFPQVLGREIGDRITVVRRPQNEGDRIVNQVLIEGFTEQVDPTGTDWSMTWRLSPADTQPYFVWDTSTWDESTRWAY